MANKQHVVKDTLVVEDVQRIQRPPYAMGFQFYQRSNIMWTESNAFQKSKQIMSAGTRNRVQ